MRLGDFTDLAENYSKYRPGYSPFVVSSVAKIVDPTARGITVADLGAGTGIFSRQISPYCIRVDAVEPNHAMREHGVADCRDANIAFHDGAAEDTGLPDQTYDLVTMASSFHWPDFTRSTAEIARLLKPGGYFLALWNTRAVEEDPLTLEIEDWLKATFPDIKRVSSGRSEFCQGLSGRLLSRGLFDEVLRLEGYHVERQSPQRYLGIWRSVNDIRVQAGPEAFELFLDFVASRLVGVAHVNAHYQTLAWLAKVRS